MAAIAPPDGIAAMAAPTARTVDQRGPDVRSPRTSIAGSGSIGMRSYLRPLGAVSVTCRAPLSSRQRYRTGRESRSEEHTSELQSLMRTSYAVFCLKKKHQICTL